MFFFPLSNIQKLSSSTSEEEEEKRQDTEEESKQDYDAIDNHKNKNNGVKVIGHRGALYEEMENTLESFRRCLEMGCDAIELDVFCLKGDGTLICFHGGGTDENPGDLSDYCLQKQTIMDLETYGEVLKLQFNSKCDDLACPLDRFSTARIPTLEEVLLLVKGKSMRVNIELKGPGTTLPVLELVERLDMGHQCTYSSFCHDRIGLIRRLRGTIYNTGALFKNVPSDFIERSLRVGASEVHLRYDTCTVERIHQIHAAGMTSMAWLCGPKAMSKINYTDVGTKEDIPLYTTLMETGVKQICCNRPDLLIKEQMQKQ